MSQTCPETSRKNPVKAIRLKCLDCSGGSSTEVAQCLLTHCALYPFRLGKNPFHTRVLTEEQREKRSAHMREVNARLKAAS